MRRRSALLAMLSVGLGRLPAAVAQPAGRTWRVGLFLGGSPDAVARQRALIVERLRTHGFDEGRNLLVETRHAAFNRAFDADHARALVAWRPDAVLVDTTPLALWMRDATRVIPIVFFGVADPAGIGLVKDFSRPGGNATGVHFSQLEIGAKRLELVRELLPAARRVMYARDIAGPDFDTLPHLKSVATRLGLELIEISVNWIQGFSYTTWASAYERPDALISGQTWGFYGMEHIADQMLRFGNEQRIPTAFWEAEIAERGATLAYGVNVRKELARAADQLARVLKGAKPAELPVDRTSGFELVVNLEAARRIGVAIPPQIVARADRVSG
jgi:putative ABC transport system substrate-binding protein